MHKVYITRFNFERPFYSVFVHGQDSKVVDFVSDLDAVTADVVALKFAAQYNCTNILYSEIGDYCLLPLD